jgi:hypothetical protein
MNPYEERVGLSSVLECIETQAVECVVCDMPSVGWFRRIGDLFQVRLCELCWPRSSRYVYTLTEWGWCFVEMPG